MLTFVGLAVTSDGCNPAIRRVILADLMATTALLVAAVLYWLRLRMNKDENANREEHGPRHGH
jgi:hypothetical protein